MGSKTKIRYCGCGAILPRCRRQCTACNEAAAKQRNLMVTEKRKKGLLPMSNGKRKGEQPAYDQVEYSDWKPRPKVQLMSTEDQLKLDAEIRRREVEQHAQHLREFGMVIAPGRPLSGIARSLTPAEIAELQGRYQPPQKRNPVLLPYLGEGVE